MGELINEIGNRYGFLTVAKQTTKNGHAAWLCQCDCGNTRIELGTQLRAGRAKVCGPKCPLKYKTRPTYKDYVGEQFGYLTVLYQVPEYVGLKEAILNLVDVKLEN